MIQYHFKTNPTGYIKKKRLFNLKSSSIQVSYQECCMRYLSRAAYLPGMLVILIIPTKNIITHLFLVDKKREYSSQMSRSIRKTGFEEPHSIIFYKTILELPRTKRHYSGDSCSHTWPYRCTTPVYTLGFRIPSTMTEPFLIRSYCHP